MATQMSEAQARAPGTEGWGRQDLTQRNGGGVSGTLLLTGLAVVGLGVLAWYYLAPEVKRYLKIQNM
jgi:hypothetical protein